MHVLVSHPFSLVYKAHLLSKAVQLRMQSGCANSNRKINSNNISVVDEQLLIFIRLLNTVSN